jgi:hypothetical protein
MTGQHLIWLVSSAMLSAIKVKGGSLCHHPRSSSRHSMVEEQLTARARSNLSKMCRTSWKRWQGTIDDEGRWIGDQEIFRGYL